CHTPSAVSMCTGLLSRCARNRLPGLAEAEQLDPAERPRSSIAETTAERTELRPTNGGAPRPRCTRNGLDAPPWFWRESPPGARRRPGPVAAWTRRGLDQALVLGDADGAGPGVDAELGEDIDEVTLHGRLGDEQLLGDLGVRGAGGQELDDFALAPSQLRPRIVHGGDGLRRDLR